MTRLLIVIAILVATVASGCSLTESSDERSRRIGLITDLNFLMVVDDWDAIWLYGHPSRLNEFHPRVGK